MQTGTQRGLEPVKFMVDKGASRFTVQVFATGLLSAFGHNPVIAIRDFEGSLEFLPGTYDKAAVQVSLRTSDLEVLDELKSDDRRKLQQAMYNEILESGRFPTASYQSQSVSVQKLGADLASAHATGGLLFHGVTQNLSVDARIADLGSLVRVSGEFSLRQSDYAIKPYSFAGGALRLKDELKFKFELVARLRE